MSSDCLIVLEAGDVMTLNLRYIRLSPTTFNLDKTNNQQRNLDTELYRQKNP